MHSNHHSSSKIFVLDGIYFAITPTRDRNPIGIPFSFEMQVEICPCGFFFFLRRNASGITPGTGLAAGEAASETNGRGLGGGHDCRWSSRPRCPVECGHAVRDAMASEPVELAASACGCAAEEPKTSSGDKQTSRCSALSGCSRPTRVRQAHEESGSASAPANQNRVSYT